MSEASPEPQPLPSHLRGRDEPSAAATLDSLFAEIAAETVDREPSLRDRARELPTSRRVGAAVATVVGVSAVYLSVQGVRSDLDTMGWVHFLLVVGLLTSVGVGASALTLRAVHQRPLHENAWRVGMLAVALPIAVSLLPGLLPGVHLDHPTFVHHLHCGVGGLIAGLAAAVSVLFFAREDRLDDWRILAASGVGGLFGYVVQGAHCAMVNVEHMVLAHAGYGVVIWGLLSLAFWSRSRTS
jgi:hypothetical protein